MKLPLVIILSFTGVIGGIVLADLFIRYIYQLQFGNGKIDILLFGKILIKQVKCDNIVEIRKLSLWESLSYKYIFSALRFGLCGIGREIVLVRLKEGIRIFPFPDIFPRKILLIFPIEPNEVIQTCSLKNSI